MATGCRFLLSGGSDESRTRGVTIRRRAAIAREESESSGSDLVTGSCRTVQCVAERSAAGTTHTVAWATERANARSPDGDVPGRGSVLPFTRADVNRSWSMADCALLHRTAQPTVDDGNARGARFFALAGRTRRARQDPQHRSAQRRRETSSASLRTGAMTDRIRVPVSIRGIGQTSVVRISGSSIRRAS